MNYVAHVRKSDRKIQTVETHLKEVSQICSKLTEKINISEVGELLGLLHDFGKYGDQFQAYIKSATGILNPDIDDDHVDSNALKGKIDHSTCGAQWIWQRFKQYGPQGELAGQILAICLASHHGGLIDCLNSDGGNSFLKRMKKDDRMTHLSECETVLDKELLNKLNVLATPQLIQKCLFQISALVNISPAQSEIVKQFKIGLWTRFIYSCLIDADRINSADFENPENKKLRRDEPVNWEIAIDRLEKKLLALPIRNDIDNIRCDISKRCKERAVEDQGIYTLTVPTGGGKTFASMRYALHHAQKHNLERIIYIIPYTSIIEQNAQEIRKLIERDDDDFPWVLEQHSNLEPEQLTWQHKLVSENWDAPVVFTTMVQFLETLFGGGTRGPRRMHQLANSVLIFDEIQTLPIKCVHLFCNAINFLTDHTKTTILLCTATQPLLNQLKNSDKGQLNIPPGNELIEDVRELFDQLKRVKINNQIRTAGWSDLEIAELAIEEFENKGSCLVIVNTKAWAQKLFELCGERIDQLCIFHLSTGLCPAHRQEILSEIRQRLDDELPVLCVSTQLIEAGVDVDFGSVIRFLAGLDSIAQAAGRCNRNGKNSTAKVHVVNPEHESIEMLKDIKEGRDKALRVLSEAKGIDLLNPDVMEQYFTYYFYQRADEMAYPVSAKEACRPDTLLNLLSDNRNNVCPKRNSFMLRQSFKTAGRIFKAIDAPTEAVIVPYREGELLIAELCAEQDPSKVRQLLKQAQKYSVNVFPNIWRKLKDKDAIIPIRGGELFYVDERHYSKEFGLSVDEVSDLEAQII
ncbi:MAG: CRISPR-associated helicase/endonuclease Cas3 [Desulfobacteraceae bacterium 4572_35.1]|nr:MAG: CRISPR-associated helicase/endonuclease Cas3 [Desulfobacteraceae bacterium 4572_35.1]